MSEDFERQDGSISDDALISVVGSAFDEGRRGREAQDVVARGRSLRRRRRATPAFAALGVVAVSASLAVAVTGPNGATAAGSGSGHSLSTTGGAVVNVDNAAFSVHTDAKTGVVTITVRESVEEDALKRVLAEAGVRAYFTALTVTQPAHQAVPFAMCTYRGVTNLSESDIDSVIYPTPSSPKTTITIDPSKMPSGSVLAFTFVQVANVPDATSEEIVLLSGQPAGCDEVQLPAGAKL